MDLQQVHIPKTGGTAFAHALSRYVHRNGHTFRLSHVRPSDMAVTIIRDPVERYVSAFDWMAGRHLWRWASADEMARAIDDELVRKALRESLVFRPMRDWLDCDREPYWIGRTESLDADVARLCDRLGIRPVVMPTGHERNAGPAHRSMSSTAIDNIRDWYADDYRLMEALRGR